MQENNLPTPEEVNKTPINETPSFIDITVDNNSLQVANSNIEHIKPKPTIHRNVIIGVILIIVSIMIIISVNLKDYTPMSLSTTEYDLKTSTKNQMARNALSSVQLYIESYNAHLQHYPRTLNDFINPEEGFGIVIPDHITVTGANLTIANGTSHIRWEFCGASAIPTEGAELGGRMSYFDYVSNSVRYWYAGTGNESLNGYCNAWVPTY